MKFLSLTILAALANALAVRSVETTKGRYEEELYNVEEKDESNVAEENQWTWDQTGGTRAFMQNVPVENEEDDTRLFMQKFAVDLNEDDSENLKDSEYRAAPGLERAEEKSSPEDDNQDVEELYEYLDSLLTQIEQCVTGDQVDIEKYLPLRKEFNDTKTQIEEFGVEGISSYFMAECTHFVSRIDETAREMCRKGLGQAENCSQI